MEDIQLGTSTEFDFTVFLEAPDEVDFAAGGSAPAPLDGGEDLRRFIVGEHQRRIELVM